MRFRFSPFSTVSTLPRRYTKGNAVGIKLKKIPAFNRDFGLSIELDFSQRGFCFGFQRGVGGGGEINGQQLAGGADRADFFAFGGGKAIEGIDVRGADFADGRGVGSRFAQCRFSCGRKLFDGCGPVLRVRIGGAMALSFNLFMTVLHSMIKKLNFIYSK